MAFQVTPRGVKVEINALQNGVPIVNVHHIQTPSTVSTADLDDILAAYDAWWTGHKDGFHPSYVLQNFTATDISVEDGVQTIFVYGGGSPGTSTGAAAAANAAVVASLRTAFTGRSFRGRHYYGGLVVPSFTDAQHISSSVASGYAVTITDLIDLLSDVNMTLCVLSRYANKVLRVVGLLTEVISVIVDTKVDSQRRRTAN